MENIVHPRLPVVGVDVLDHCVADSRAADGGEDEWPLFSRRLEFGSTVDDDVDIGQSVSESCHVSTETFTLPLASADDRVDDVLFLPSEEATSEVPAVGSIDDSNDVISAPPEQEPEKSDCVSSVVSEASSSFAASSTSVLNAVRENSLASESCEALSALEVQSRGNDELPRCSEAGPQQHQHTRKRRHSTTSANDADDDSESEPEEIEVQILSYCRWHCSICSVTPRYILKPAW